MDIWTTQDGYHIQDIIDNGRCVICGKLASDLMPVQGKTFCRHVRVCDSDTCAGQVNALQNALL